MYSVSVSPVVGENCGVLLGKVLGGVELGLDFVGWGRGGLGKGSGNVLNGGFDRVCKFVVKMYLIVRNGRVNTGEKEEKGN